MENNRQNSAILLMHCPDQPGIIAVITEFINTNGGNILYLDQYVDKENGIFYMRVEWDLMNFIIPTEKINDYFNTLYAGRYNGQVSISEMMNRFASTTSTHGIICLKNVTLFI